MQVEGVSRRPTLIAFATKKMAVTYLLSALCAAGVTIIDSLIAGVSIGPEALAAIAAAAPILSIDQILHCMLGFGIEKLMIQAIGEGDRRRANRIFGAVLVAVFFVYAVVFGILLIAARPLFQSIMGDVSVVDQIIRYTTPLFLASPLFESLLCVERAFRIDGRAKLFSKRGIVTNVANILLDILMVSVLGLGISGLAWASVLSTMVGYTITLSHFFSKKRTVSPDFSVVHSPKEFRLYVKQDMLLGRSATLDEVTDSLSLVAQTAVVGMVGGDAGLAIWAVYKSLRGVVLAASNGVSASVSVHAGLLYGQKDYEGVRFSVKEGVQIALMSALGITMIVFFLAGYLTDVYKIVPEYARLCTQCLRIGSIAFPAVAFMIVLTVYLPSVDRVKLSSRLVMVQYVLTLASAVVGYVAGLQALFVAYVVAMWVSALVFVALLVRDRLWFVPQHNVELIAEYTVQLESSKIESVTADVNKQLGDIEFSEPFCSRVALLVEESLSFIAQSNPKSMIDADIELRQHDGKILLIITDGGLPYNPLIDVAKLELERPGILEKILMSALTTDVRYDRALDLNRMSLTMMPVEVS